MGGLRWAPCWVWLKSILSVAVGAWSSPVAHRRARDSTQASPSQYKVLEEVPTEATLMGQQSRTLIAEGEGGWPQREGTRG